MLLGSPPWKATDRFPSLHCPLQRLLLQEASETICASWHLLSNPLHISSSVKGLRRCCVVQRRTCRLSDSIMGSCDSGTVIRATNCFKNNGPHCSLVERDVAIRPRWVTDSVFNEAFFARNVWSGWTARLNMSCNDAVSQGCCFMSWPMCIASQLWNL